MKIDPSTFQTLEKVFHEKSRLAIVACLAESADGVGFTVLREACGLTDGNLKAHLTALAAAGVVSSHRETGAGRPKTTVLLTEAGREQFATYLCALEDALREAARAMGADEKSGRILSSRWREA